MWWTIATHALAIGAGVGGHAWIVHRGTKAALSDIKTAVTEVAAAVKKTA